VYDAQDSLVAEVKGVGDDAPSVKRVPPPGVLESDARLLNELGKRYRAATGSAVKSDAGDAGTFARWCYEHRGLFTLSAALWDIPIEDAKKEKDGGKKGAGQEDDDAPKEGSDDPKAEGDAKEGGAENDDASAPAEPEPKALPDEASKADDETKTDDAQNDDSKKEDPKRAKDDAPKPSDDAKRLEWIDSAGPEESWRFLPWKPFEHPELGPVEIGGLAPFARLEPPPAEGGAIAAKHAEWFLTLGALLPRVTLAECTRETLGEGVQRVTAVIQNDGFLPLLSRSGRRAEAIRPAKVRLLLPDAGVRLGGRAQELLDDLPGSGGRKEYTWLVQGPAEMEIAVTVESTHAGSATRVAEPKDTGGSKR
jgi:hypothetical protein